MQDAYRPYLTGRLAEVHLAQTFLLATLSHAVRRKTGALIVEVRDSIPYIIGSGCNGTSPGECNRCETSDLSTTLPGVIHAEINALRDLPPKKGFRILYCTDSPCEFCLDAIVNKGHEIDAVVYARKYRITDHLDNAAIPCYHFDDTSRMFNRYDLARDGYSMYITGTPVIKFLTHGEHDARHSK